MLIREYRESDRFWAEPFMRDEFGGPLQARRGELIDVLALPGLVAERDGVPLGLVTYRLENDECELAFIASLERHAGVGTALLDAVVEAVAGCERIWLVTTNDNLEALRFYQRRGFVLSALRVGAVDEAREQLKPQISTVGEFGIRLRDELELELRPEARPGQGRR
jgi:ribosomal protein S18 acetylase RimI-like enzyme